MANDKTLLSKKLSEAIKQEFAQSVHTQEHIDLLVSLVEKEVHELRDEDDLLTLKSLISNCLDSIVVMSPSSSVSQELSEPEDADIELF